MALTEYKLDMPTERQKSDDNNFRRAIEKTKVSKLVKFNPSRSTLLSSVQLQNQIGDHLDTIINLFELSGGIVYLPDHSENVLNIADYKVKKKALTIEEKVEIDKASFDYHVDGLGYQHRRNSLAARVYESRSILISENATNDEAHFDERTRKIFGIDSQVIGIPLTLHGRRYGVLIVWSNTTFIDELIAKKIVKFARYISSDVSMAIETLRNFCLQQTHVEIQQSSLKRQGDYHSRIVQHALNSILFSGFQRARFLTFSNDGQSLIWEGAATTLDEAHIADPKKFIKPFYDNPYFLHVLSECGKIELKSISQVAGIFDKISTVTSNIMPFSHAYSHDLFGDKSHYYAVDREEGAPWAISPIVVGNYCIGVFAADNKYKNTNIEPDSLFHLSYISYLAGSSLLNTINIDKKFDFYSDLYHSRLCAPHSPSSHDPFNLIDQQLSFSANRLIDVSPKVIYKNSMSSVLSIDFVRNNLIEEVNFFAEYFNVSESEVNTVENFDKNFVGFSIKLQDHSALIRLVIYLQDELYHTKFSSKRNNDKDGIIVHAPSFETFQGDEMRASFDDDLKKRCRQVYQYSEFDALRVDESFESILSTMELSI